MTSWLPTLAQNGNPLYVQLADQIADAALQGVLQPGEKLPPQRNLAFDVGVTLGTVTRAYALLKERGIATGEVGRGTFIRNGQAEVSVRHRALQAYQGITPQPQPARLLMNSTSTPEVGQAAIMAGLFEDIASNQPSLLSDYIRHMPDHWRLAGQRWIAPSGWTPALEDVLATQGAHGALMAVINATTASGDRIVFEELTYPATVRCSMLMGRQPVAVRSTQSGMDPDDFERCCAQQHPKLAIIVSTCHNPTLAVMPDENRRRIAEIARRYNVLVIDDDTFGVLRTNRPMPLAAYAPERVFHVTSLSKSMAAGVRTGWVACPPGYAQRVMNAQRLINGSAAGAMIEIASRMVLSGQADALCQKVRAEIRDRVVKARMMLAGHDLTSHEECPFAWLRLPDPWVPATFCKAALRLNVVLEEADTFKAGQIDRSVPCVRIALTGALQADQVDAGLDVIRQLLDQPSLAYERVE